VVLGVAQERKQMETLNRIVVALALSTLCLSTMVSSSPMYGGDRPSVARELPNREREVKLNQGVAECVRTAWIGDVNNRTLICVEYRYRKESK
jgi:hypothetical protein